MVSLAAVAYKRCSEFMYDASNHGEGGRTVPRRRLACVRLWAYEQMTDDEDDDGTDRGTTTTTGWTTGRTDGHRMTTATHIYVYIYNYITIYIYIYI